ncbi:MAG: bifunctional oligoribonuclease/PAP phosphatase NrnA [Verrucomicrobium sp.]|nr:bifunctional oligoribonuclease/PAP phosphatase NrnA [Verrucomicrobium sp.]
MDPTLLREIDAFLQAHESFCVLSHIRPDADACGTALAFALSLEAKGKRVRVFNQDSLPETLRFLPGSERVEKTPAEPVGPETGVICVDTSTLERTGETFLSWNRKPDLNLDHHASNPGYARINLVDDTSPAASQTLFEVIEKLGLPCPPEAAANLYAGIMTDTGSFRYRQTTVRTFEVAAQLVRRGADPSLAAQQCFQTVSPAAFRLLREAMNGTRFAFGDRVAYYHLTPDLYARTGAKPEEVENFLDPLRSVRTVEVAFMLEQVEGGKIRASLRSRARVDVNAIAAQFGGGGHRLAAGFRSSKPLAELEAALLQAIGNALPQD